MKNRFSVFDGEIYDSTAGLIFADGESVYRATPVKDDDLTLLKEIIRRANAFEPGGEVERLRAIVEALPICIKMDKRTASDGAWRFLADVARAALAQEPADAKG